MLGKPVDAMFTTELLTNVMASPLSRYTKAASSNPAIVVDHVLHDIVLRELARLGEITTYTCNPELALARTATLK